VIELATLDVTIILALSCDQFVLTTIANVCHMQILKITIDYHVPVVISALKKYSKVVVTRIHPPSCQLETLGFVL